MRSLLFGTQQRRQKMSGLEYLGARCRLLQSKTGELNIARKTKVLPMWLEPLRYLSFLNAGCIFFMCSVFFFFFLFPYPNKAELQRDDTVSKDAGTWHSSYSIINLLISVQNELISRANSLSKTWVKHFYVFALAQCSHPTAQWTKSLSGTNNPPTPGSVASLERCQVLWVYALWRDPSRVWLGLLAGDTTLVSLKSTSWQWHRWWRVQWVTARQQADTQEPDKNGITISSVAFYSASQEPTAWEWGEPAAVNYRHLLLFLTPASVFASTSVCLCHVSEVAQSEWG